MYKLRFQSLNSLKTGIFQPLKQSRTYPLLLVSLLAIFTFAHFTLLNEVLGVIRDGILIIYVYLISV